MASTLPKDKKGHRGDPMYGGGPFSTIVDYAGDAYQVTPNGITSSAEIGMIGGMPVGFKASTEKAILGTQKTYGRKPSGGNRSGE